MNLNSVLVKAQSPISIGGRRRFQTRDHVFDEGGSSEQCRKPINKEASETFSKVPEVTLVFWIIKILATTLGETGGDAVSMSMNLGYLVSTAIFAFIFIVAVVIQVCAKTVDTRTRIATGVGASSRASRSPRAWLQGRVSPLGGSAADRRLIPVSFDPHRNPVRPPTVCGWVMFREISR